MSKIGHAIHDMHHLDAMAAGDRWMNRVHPLMKLILTVVYVMAVVSYDKYNFKGLFTMGIGLLTVLAAGRISVWRHAKGLGVVMLLICAVGVLNPFYDRTPMYLLGNFTITGGMISMMTLLIKGVLTVLASYTLMVTTSITKLCYALRLLHIPKSIVTVFALIYRYVIVLLKEVERMQQAYQLRAPGQKGIHISTWGSFIGQLLLRSIDRAQIVYESMLLRGYDGEFRYSLDEGEAGKS
ncbi:MAG: cobalt ECF transporter T component CbiQ [bacterium]|nr:cobalt ECF transporter T component CbiQ [bacterium]